MPLQFAIFVCICFTIDNLFVSSFFALPYTSGPKRHNAIILRDLPKSPKDLPRPSQDPKDLPKTPGDLPRPFPTAPKTRQGFPKRAPKSSKSHWELKTQPKTRNQKLKTEDRKLQNDPALRTARCAIKSAATRRVGACLNSLSKFFEIFFEFFELKESSQAPRIPPG